MENLELRRKVAIALGCEAVIRKARSGGDALYLFCECSDEINTHSEYVYGKSLVKRYELDHHHAIDALMEFCASKKYRFSIHKHCSENGEFYIVRIQHEVWEISIGLSQAESLAVAICLALVSAAEKSEKKEAGG